MLENAGKTRAIIFLCGGGGMKLNLDPHSPNLVSVVSWLLHHSLGCFWICTVQGQHCETLLVCSAPFEGSCSQCSAVSGPCGRPVTSEIQSLTLYNLLPSCLTKPQESSCQGSSHLLLHQPAETFPSYRIQFNSF